MSGKGKRKATEEDLSKIVGADHFGSEDSGTSMITDPVQPTPMVISLDDIETYDNNPRRMDNSAYDEIKQGLLETGSQGITLTITRRPGSKKFIPDAGGNTRILILKELYAKTGDEKYYHLTVKFIPYTKESKIIISHLVENDVRGSYVFIDKALGVRSAYNQLFEESGQEYTQRSFIEYLNTQGYSTISRALLIPMNYAIDHLYEFIPNALDSGAGRPKVEQLRQIETKYLDYWMAHELDKNDFMVHWHQVLQSNDSWDSFSVDLVEGDILSVITDRVMNTLVDYPALITSDTIKLEVNQFQKNPDLVSTLSKEPNYGWPVDDEHPVTVIEADNPVKEPAPVSVEKPLAPKIEPEEADQKNSSEQVPEGASLSATATDSELTPTKLIADSVGDLVTNRAQCYESALAIAKEHGFSDLIKRLDSGYGYYCELPDAPFHVMDELKAYLWWQLFLIASLHIYDNYSFLPEHSNYRVLVSDLMANSPPLETDDAVRDFVSQVESSINHLVACPPGFTIQTELYEPESLENDVFRQFVFLQTNRRLIQERYKHEDIWTEL